MCSWFVLVCEYEEINLRRIADFPFVFLFVFFLRLAEAESEGGSKYDPHSL